MSNDYSPRSGGAPRRGRRRSGTRGGARTERPTRTEKKPETLVGKIQSFFKKTFGGPKKTAKAGTAAVPYTNGSARTKPESTPKPPRKESSVAKSALEEPNPDLVTGPRLYVGNLSYDTAESDLFDLFSTAGGVRNVELVMDRRANRSKGFGFVEMTDIDVAKAAVMKLHRSEFMGRPLIVSGAKSDRREAEATPDSI